MASTTKPSTTSSSMKAQRPPLQTCLCSPTAHPGSFRCSFHRSTHRKVPARPAGQGGRNPVSPVDTKGVGEGSKLLKAFLMQMIRPSKGIFVGGRISSPSQQGSL
ncbi:hypothetical protein QJS10_CPB19g00597 [Acorus calamus]|uniref:Serine-rich protein-like protein n=1 Tax=Acorus calamus TaxID=4465 RepID=A0AAV9CIB7_ACOCL|nr:hypothetical protein QJS10_CPB19g00597 [Acorus calamus]